MNAEGRPRYESGPTDIETTGTGFDASTVADAADGSAPGSGFGDLPPKHPRGPDQHKQVVRALGLRSVTELQVLSAETDPYYCGTRSQVRDARWFARWWESSGATGHLRRLHYRMLSAGALTALETPYLNTDRCWRDLCSAASSARALELVDPEAVTDARNDPPRLYVYPRTEPVEPGWSWSSWSSDQDRPEWEPPEIEPPELSEVESWRLPEASCWSLPSIGYWTPPEWSLSPLPERPDVVVSGYDYDTADQPVLLEVWIEKTGVDDVLDPVCRELDVNLLSGAGYTSITRIVELLRRAEAQDRAVHVLYVSDFDPAGENMPVAVARQAQYWRETLGIDAEITVEQVALTAEQVREYELPPVPDKPRYTVELDALEALRPGVLARLVREAVAPWRDPHLRQRLRDARREADQAAGEQWEADTADLREELDDAEGEVRETLRQFRETLRSGDADLRRDLAPERAELDRLRTELTAALAPVVQPFGTRLDAVAERVTGKIGQHRQTLATQADELTAALDEHRQRLAELADEAERITDEFDPDLPDRPEPVEPEIDRSRFLFDSRRHWWEQLAAYRRARNRGAP